MARPYDEFVEYFMSVPVGYFNANEAAMHFRVDVEVINRWVNQIAIEGNKKKNCPLCGAPVDNLYPVYPTADSEQVCAGCKVAVLAWIKLQSEQKNGKICPLMSFRVGGGDGENQPNTREVCCRQEHCAWWNAQSGVCGGVMI